MSQATNKRLPVSLALVLHAGAGEFIDPRFLSPARWGNVIKRCGYHSEGPSAVWHHDGCHHLIAYKIVIHGCVDGYSR